MDGDATPTKRILAGDRPTGRLRGMMSSESAPRNDEQVQNAARSLFHGVAPERRSELEALWNQYKPRFNLLLDTGPDGLFVMDAGLYRDVRFNHRAMRAFWLASFVAWEGYRAFSESVEAVDLSKFRDMVRHFRAMLASENPEAVSLPQGVPEPGAYPDKGFDPQASAAAELATFATGWAFLHEIRHLQHQQAGTGAGADAPPADRHAEELSCDAFATAFILERIGEYAQAEGVPEDQVRLKREMGIYFALFAMTLISAEAWQASDSHPAMQTRIDEVIRAMGRGGTHFSDAMAHASFGALWCLYPDAPGPFKMQAA